MELFDKKFVRFMWDDELEGKEVFVADNINSLIERVEKGASIYKVRWSRDNGMPFEGDDLVRYRFAYYDPNYEVKKAYNEGREIQFKDDVSGEWRSAYNPRWDLNIEYRIKPKNNCVAYLARLSDDYYYLTACYENQWESVQKGYGAKTKLFVGSEGEVRKWYESREKFKDLIKAWEDGKEIQVKTSIGVWHLVFMPDWNVDIEYRVKPEGDKMTPTWSNIEDCRHCVYEPKATTQEPCRKCFGKSMFKPKEKEEEMKDKMNPIQEKKMQRYNLKVKDWDELKEMAVKMFKGIAALNERFARKISGDEFITQDDWKMMNDLWRTFNYTNDNNQLCKDDLYHLFTEDDPDEEFVEIKAEEAKDKKKLRPYINSAEMIADFIARFKVDCPPYEEPSIWVKEKETDSRHLVTSFVPNSDDGSYVVLFDYTCDLYELFNEYTYLDGSPVGKEC